MADNENTEVEELETEVEDTEQESTEEEEFVPLSKEETETLREQLKKANAEAKKNRLALKEQKAQAESANTDEDKTAEAVKAAEDKWRGRLINTSLKGSLASAGFTGNVDRALKLIDSSEFEVDEDGNVDSDDLAAAIAGLREDIPGAFAPVKPRPGKAGGGARGDAPERKLTPSERQARAAGVFKP